MARYKTIKDRESSLKELLLYFKEKDVPYRDVKAYLDEAYLLKPIKEEKKPVAIPVSVFNNSHLSALESIVKYLRENQGLRFSEIAKLINRDQRAIGVTYRFASKKMHQALQAQVSKHSLPVSVVAERKLSVLESIVYYLKHTYSLSYHDVAALIRRDDRTVWTVYQRALRKL